MKLHPFFCCQGSAMRGHFHVGDTLVTGLPAALFFSQAKGVFHRFVCGDFSASGVEFLELGSLSGGFAGHALSINNEGGIVNV